MEENEGLMDGGDGVRKSRPPGQRKKSMDTRKRDRKREYECSMISEKNTFNL